MKVDLPLPSADQQAHSERLADALRAEIQRAGPMPFSRWMERCLYAPGLGYYSAGSVKFGAAGDFVTAPELGPLFAQCIATSVSPTIRALGADAQMIELGGGSGAFAEAVLLELSEQNSLPSTYAIVEPSADLRERQRTRLQSNLPLELFAQVAWLDAPPSSPWQGVLFANEVIDALPVSRFAIIENDVFEEHVEWDGEHFIIVDQPADANVLASVRRLEKTRGRLFADGYRSELLPQLSAWIEAVAASMQRGIALFVDYGHNQRDYYAERRSSGTLQCYYQHRVHDDALALPGLQDITASVDFSAVATAASSLGFAVHGYASQSQFLLGNGLVDHHQRAAADSDAMTLYGLSQQIKRLTMPDQMGERFQVLMLMRDIDATVLPDFSGFNRSHTL